jgi:hypothetical protein
VRNGVIEHGSGQSGVQSDHHYDLDFELSKDYNTNRCKMAIQIRKNWPFCVFVFGE